MRQIVLDTETTGLETADGHRILEIGCVEIIDRKLTHNHYHRYINPQRDSDQGALEVHGLTQKFLQTKKLFRDIWPSLIEYVRGAELIIHNAPFDVAFINAEMKLLDTSLGVITDYCTVLDSLVMAKQKHPGQKNNLDALCKRYAVDNSRRELHGALLDSEVLADVYLLMTGGQVSFNLGTEVNDAPILSAPGEITPLESNRPELKVIRATAAELLLHEKKLDQIDQASTGAVWRQEPITSSK